MSGHVREALPTQKTIRYHNASAVSTWTRNRSARAVGAQCRNRAEGNGGGTCPVAGKGAEESEMTEGGRDVERQGSR